MDINNRSHDKEVKTMENVNANLTSQSFATYSALQNPKNKLNISKIVLSLMLITLLSGSILIFGLNIKRAFFDKSNSPETTSDGINKIKSEYDSGENIKVENVTKEISDLFDIPIGVKIIEINSDVPQFYGLRIDDIIVDISGISVTNIVDFTSYISTMMPESSLQYKVYRNGVYLTISPFDYE